MNLPRVPLCILPTPCHRLERASAELGIELWIKRDDLTGFALGGNKGRKLEFLMAKVRAEGYQAVVSCGSSQSNFLRQLAAACAVEGVECHTVVMDLPYDAAAGKPTQKPLTQSGNALLLELFGAQVHRFPDADWEVLYQHAKIIADWLTFDKKKTLNIPIGGSSPEGIHAFVLAAQEVDPDFDAVLFASSSGSTHVGLATHFAGSKTKVIGIAADPEPGLVEDFADLSEQYAALSQTQALLADQFDLRLDYVGPGYGLESPAGIEASRWLIKNEGILLDPIYSAKAFSGLLDLVANKEVGGKVLFWHTGGIPSIFAR